MQVLYDGHIFRWQRAGGISRYFYEVILNLPTGYCPVVIGVEKSSTIPRRAGVRVSFLSSIRPRRVTQPIKTAWWHLAYFRSSAIFHPTYYNLSGGLQYNTISSPVVVTVHDLIHRHYYKLIDDADSTMKWQEQAIQRADHVICVSRATELQVLDMFPATAGKTSVIHHGSSFPIADGPQTGSIFSPPTFLFVGGRAGYKAFSFLLRAFAKASQVCSDIQLQVAGPAFTSEERWLIHFLGISDRVTSFPFPNEHQLHHLYKSCVALLYPSIHEGFGIPPLEAMACGTVAVTANTTSLPEVMGDAGILLPPLEEDAWVDCIERLANDKVNRNRLISKGFSQARRFSWQRSADQHAAVYSGLLP